MAFIRLAHVIFFADSMFGLAPQAVAWSNQLGADWMEARAVTLPVPAASALTWADLWVTLDAAALAVLPPVPHGVQHRHYPFQPELYGEQVEFERLRQRVAGMVSGMRMLQRASLMNENFSDEE